ncbi:MAG: MFS transporter [Woeseiaceae bacterium]
MREKPVLSFWQIWNMCFGFLGIQFGFALQNANVSRIFQTLGASIDEIPILWIAAPLTGLLVQPIIGYLSDHTWNRLGRRRPYFLSGAVLASLALLVMPNSPVLWVAAGMLWMMDASINITMEPFRAFVGDMLPERQRTAGFAMQTFFIGIGAVVASALPYLMSHLFDISNTAPPGHVPESVKLSFYLGGAVFLLAVLWTVIRTPEYSPDELAAFDAARPPEHLGGSEPQSGSRSAFREVMHDLIHMPRVMRQLAVVQFFSWFALFAMWIYGTSAVTSHHFGATDVTSSAYNDGADWVGVLFAAYNGFAALAAIAIPFIAGRLGCRICHLFNMTLGGIGLISFYFIRDPDLLLVPMIGVGIAWASILSLPYALLSSNLPSNKMGVYMGIFNFFIVIPQLVAASVLGLVLRVFFDLQSIYGLVIGGVLMIVAGFATLLVDKEAEPR